MITVDLSPLAPLLEPLAVLTGITSVALVVRQHIVNWPVGIVSSALFLVIFAGAGLYADSALQVMYIGLGFYGWWHWSTGGPRGSDLRVTQASPRVRAGLILGAVLSALALGTFLDTATDSTVPYPDAATMVLSITAQLLLTRKNIETWPVWIFGVNLPYLAIYLYKGLAMTAALQLVYIALSFAGWVAWRRSMAAQAVAGPLPGDVALAPVTVEVDR